MNDGSINHLNCWFSHNILQYHDLLHLHFTQGIYDCIQSYNNMMMTFIILLLLSVWLFNSLEILKDILMPIFAKDFIGP